jgi:transposase
MVSGGIEMSRAMVPHRDYTIEFKSEAVRLANEVGVTQAARRLDMPTSSLQNWMKPSYASKLAAVGVSGKKTVSDVQAETGRLRRELASLKVDNEILRKAAAYFAKGSR